MKKADGTELSYEEAALGLVAVLGVIMKMSDEAKALGGATSLSGVASLHKMQTSLQKNGPRMASLAAIILEKKHGSG